MSESLRRRWDRRELMLAYRLYCELPFGQLDQRNPRVVRLAEYLQRTPGSVALKLVNLAHLDPALRARGIRGMANVSELDRVVAAEFAADWERSIESTEGEWQAVQSTEPLVEAAVETEGEATAKVRLTQDFFRRAILTAYEYLCCACGLSSSQLLVASHIAPWAAFPRERTNPRNGLCLCALHDKAFDAGLLTVMPSFDIRINQQLLEASHRNPVMRVAFVELHEKQIHQPSRFIPDAKLLGYHNAYVFHP